ncbi:ESX secretion-associated protein EspG [Mycobacterium deserti]|uniref:ESX secretion-associated protein EspG n=1 Tax=Mycobacterium deserti TaxID=2978347 RepID=A0ABT2MBR1_9MYCO|nr:ESX secretion-associated protein EspG [Mycobacterium deserti]MCT7659706.1 ESX secretion-associated protein EspG [Mycobacterium deserti]
MTTSLTERFVVTDDEMMVIASRVGVQALPLVLNLRPRHGTETALLDATDHATRALTDRGLIRDGEVVSELAPLLQALQRPDRELAMRLVTPDGAARLTVIRRGVQCVSVRRVGNEIVIEAVLGDPNLSAAARAVLRQLPTASPAAIEPVGAPLENVAQALSDTHDAAQLSDRIRALGADARAAMVLGSALASRLAFAEIVYYSLDVDADLIARCPAAVGVFYTKRGRIVAAPSASPSGQRWTTLKPGSDHAVKQAIGQLVELSANRWEEF